MTLPVPLKFLDANFVLNLQLVYGALVLGLNLVNSLLELFLQLLLIQSRELVGGLVKNLARVMLCLDVLYVILQTLNLDRQSRVSLL